MSNIAYQSGQVIPGNTSGNTAGDKQALLQTLESSNSDNGCQIEIFKHELPALACSKKFYCQTHRADYDEA